MNHLPNKADKTDAGNGSYGICRVIGASRSPSPDQGRSFAEEKASTAMIPSDSAALFRSLAVDLRALLELAGTAGQDSAEWHDFADQMRVNLSGIYEPIYELIPHELEHYLDDADIRDKDVGYRKSQEAEMMGFLPIWTTEAA